MSTKRVRRRCNPTNRGRSKRSLPYACTWDVTPRTDSTKIALHFSAVHSAGRQGRHGQHTDVGVGGPGSIRRLWGRNRPRPWVNGVRERISQLAPQRLAHYRRAYRGHEEMIRSLWIDMLVGILAADGFPSPAFSCCALVERGVLATIGVGFFCRRLLTSGSAIFATGTGPSPSVPNMLSHYQAQGSVPRGLKPTYLSAELSSIFAASTVRSKLPLPWDFIRIWRSNEKNA